MITEVKKTNGVDLEQLATTVAAIQDNPEVTKFQFRATNKWIDGGRNVSEIKGFYAAGKEDDTRTQPFVLEADEPQVLLSTDMAPNPAEYIIHALSACLTTSMVYHAAANGVVVEKVESSIAGNGDLHGFLGLSEDVRKGYEGIKITLKVKSDASEEQLKSFTEFSPVYDMISNPVPVTIEITK